MAESTTHIIQYLADIKNVQNKLRELDRINKSTAAKFGTDFTKATDIVSRQIDRVSQKSINIKGGPTIQTLAQFSTVVKNANGQLQTLTEKGKLVNGQFQVTNSTMKRGAATTRTFVDNVATLAKRAALTIPTWILLRQAVLGTFRAIRDGIQITIDFDRALQKARRNLQGSAAQITADFGTLKDEITRLSLDTGESVVTITNAFQKFATVGFDFETSLAGAANATKLAILLFGDAEETANAFARSMRVLVDRSKDAIPPSEQIAEAMALTAELWEINAFEINEFTQSLEKFAGTAKTANFTTQQTVALLATLSTAGLRAGRGGTLLRTSVHKLVANLDQLAGTLGIKVNPQLDTTFDVLIRVLDGIEKLTKQSKLAPAATEAIAEIFGGVRSAEPVRALIALNKELKNNLALRGDVQRFNADFLEVNETLFRQTEQVKNLNIEIKRAFITGLAGGKEYEQQLGRIIEFQKNARIGINLLGQFARKAFQAFAGAPEIIDIGAIEQNVKDADIKIKTEFDKLLKGIGGRLSKAELEALLVDVIEGNITIDPQVRIRVEGALRSQLQKIETETDLGVTVRGLDIDIKKQQEVAKLVLKDQLARLKAQGASNAQLLKAKQILSEQFKIVDGTLTKLDRQLNLEREITEEKRLQTTLSSETTKLFRIAQTEGSNIAQRIGDVLAGEIDFSTFIRRGGKAVEIFKKQFADVFEEQQALQFFRGETVSGLQGLRGGRRIAIREEEIRRPISALRSTAAISRARALEKFAKLEIESVSDVNVNVEGLDFSEAAQKIQADTLTALSNPESPFSKKIDERLQQF